MIDKTTLLILNDEDLGGRVRATEELLQCFRNKYIHQFEVKWIKTPTVTTRNTTETKGYKFNILLWVIRYILVVFSGKLLNSVKYSIVYSNNIIGAFVFLILKRSGKTYYHFHGELFIAVRDQLLKSSTSYVKSVYYFCVFSPLILIERYCMWHCEKIFVPSTFSKNIILMNFPSLPTAKVIVAINSINRRVFVISKKSRAIKIPKFLIAGRMDESKNYDLILDSFHNLMEKKYIFKIIFCYIKGANIKEEERIINKVKKIKLHEIHSNLSPDIMSQIYRNVSISMFLGEQEGLPLVYLESLASGTPVITLGIGDMLLHQRKIDKRLIVKQNTVDSLVDTLIYTLTSVIPHPRKYSQKCLHEINMLMKKQSSHVLEKYLFESNS